MFKKSIATKHEVVAMVRGQYREAKRRLKKGQAPVVYFERRSSITKLNSAMRRVFIQAYQRSLDEGQIKSDVLVLFKVINIVSPKCFVVTPINEIAMTCESKPVKLCLKVLNTQEVKEYCQCTDPSDIMVEGLIDNWIYMKPASPHISRAFAVYRDNCGNAQNQHSAFMQMSQYFEGHEDLYAMIKALGLHDKIKTEIPSHLHHALFLYIMQVSSAFEFAHANDLTHGAFDLSQVVVDHSLNDFQMINPRPWLVYCRKFPQQGEEKYHKNMRLRYAKSMDLYNFGVSIYEMMTGKIANKNEPESYDQQRKNYEQFKETSHEIKQKIKKTFTVQQEKDKKEQEASREKLIISQNHGVVDPQSMPNLEYIPKPWAKMQQTACLIEILHMCFLVETQRNTSDVFCKIKKLASQYYQRFYDPGYQEYPDLDQVSSQLRIKCLASSLNNRAVMQGPKIIQQQLTKRIDYQLNDKIVTEMSAGFEQACKIYEDCYEAYFNLTLLQWMQGKLFDEDFCHKIKARITDKYSAQMMIMTFRKAIGLPVNQMEERKLMVKMPTGYTGDGQTTIAQRLHSKYCDIYKNDRIHVQNNQNHFTKLSALIDDENAKNQRAAENKNIVKKIFFSKNERFIVIITHNLAIVVELTEENFEVFASIDLPNTSPQDQDNEEPIEQVSLSENSSSCKSELNQSNTEDEPFEKEQREAEHVRHVKHCSLASGFFSSVWVATIDDKGRRLALHDTSYTRNTVVEGANVLQCTIHVYHGNNMIKHTEVEVGQIIGEEIIEMMFDEDEVKENIENTTEAEKQLDKRDIEVQETLALLEDAIRLEEQSLAGHNQSTAFSLETQQNSVDKLMSRQSQSIEESQIKKQLVSFKKPKNRQVLTVHCKNLYAFMINISNEIYRDEVEDEQDLDSESVKKSLPSGKKPPPGTDIQLMKEPQKLAGGATLPISIFREASRDKGQPFPTVIPSKEAFGEFQTQHFDHIKEFIEEQEMAGNLVKMPRYNNESILVFQKEKSKEYAPHFFIYDILSRRVTRRFLPLSPEFSLFWETDTNESHGHHCDSSLDSHENKHMHLDDLQTVTCFEVSPQGTFLVAVVNEEFFSLKYLPAGMCKGMLDSIKPYYYSEINTQEIKEEKNLKEALDEVQSSSQEDDEMQSALSDSDFEGLNSQPGYEKGQLAYRLAALTEKIQIFEGSEYERHSLSYKYWKLVRKSLRDPQTLFINRVDQKTKLEALTNLLSPEKDSEAKENLLVSPRTLEVAFKGLREFNSSFSIRSGFGANEAKGQPNIYSEKTSLHSIKKFSLFNSVQFGRAEDKIRLFTMSSMPNTNYIAVFFRRSLQIYDTTRQGQIFEVFLPSCTMIKFVNSDTILCAQDGDSQLYLCSVEAQRKVWQNKDSSTRTSDKMSTISTKENFGKYHLGLLANRLSSIGQEDSSSEEEVDKATVNDKKSIKVIRSDEPIQKIVCARSNSNFSGYMAIICESQVTIYLTQMDDHKVFFDLIYTYQFWELSQSGLGTIIDHMDFSQSCEEFIAITNRMLVVEFSIKNAGTKRVITQLEVNIDKPISQMQAVGHHGGHIALYSEENSQLIVVYNTEAMMLRDHTRSKGGIKAPVKDEQQEKVKRLNLKSNEQKFGKLSAMKVDNSNQFIICVFENNKVGLFRLQELQFVKLVALPAGISFKDVHIDDLTSLMSCLDETRTFINILIFDWHYAFDKPDKRSLQRTKTKKKVKGSVPGSRRAKTQKHGSGVSSQIDMIISNIDEEEDSDGETKAKTCNIL